MPGGSALIENSMVINAEWDGGQIMAYDMSGREYDSVSLPVSQPSSCALGGRDGRVLFVTSAREGLTQDEIERQPHAGVVFAVQSKGMLDGC